MPQFSAGLAVGSPSTPQLVFLPSFPFVKSFYVSNAIWYAVLEFDVVTSYDTWSNAADVRVNGISVGQVPPRSFAQTGNELAPVAIIFHTWVLQAPATLGRTGFNELQIVPQAGQYLILGNWRIHFNQLLQP